jgi:hypothetical protein
MKVLAVGRPRVGVDPGSAIARHEHEELDALWRLYASDRVREMYSPGGPGAVLVLEVESIDVAHELLAELPLVTNQIVDFELIELTPFSAFATLFASSGRP